MANPDRPATAPPTLGSALLLGLIAGMISGALELLARAYRFFVDGRFEELTRLSLWTIPAVLAGFAMVALTLVWAAGRRWPVAGRLSTLVGVAGGWALLSPLLVFGERLHWAAIVIIAVGVGVQLGRFAAGRPPSPRRIARGAATVSVVVALGVTVALIGERRARVGSREGRAEPGASAPNVLLLVLDTVRAASLSLYGSRLPTTPFLEELGHRGFVFEAAVAAAPWTLPSHASMFTGRWPSELRADWLSALEGKETTVAEVLATRGYRTGGFVANLQATSAETGLAQGFEHYDDHRFQLDEVVRGTALGFRLFNPLILWRVGEQPVGRKPARVIREAFLDWVGTGRGKPPFFAFLNFFDAHIPYDPDQSHLGRFGPVTELSGLRGGRTSGGNRVRQDSAWIAERQTRYAEAIATIDDEIRAIVAGLDSRGLLENTVIIVTADHGELIGEHGLFGHGHSLYIDEIRVPLVIVPRRGVAEGRRIERPVSLRDLGQTIADLTGAAAPQLGGTSLRPVWEGDSSARPSPVISMVSRIPDRRSKVPVAKGDMASLVEGQWHYILNGDSTVELYHLGTDPVEAKSLQGVAGADTLRQLDAVLKTVWKGRASLAPALKEGTTIAATASSDQGFEPLVVGLVGRGPRKDLHEPKHVRRHVFRKPLGAEPLEIHDRGALGDTPH